MKQMFRLTIVLTFLTISFPSLHSQSVSVLLQQGIFAEETEGDLNAAIKIYEDIVSQTDLSRAIAAQALYRLGLCHLKLGNKDKAATALNKLLSNYTEQESLVALARKQLEQSNPTVITRRIWKDAIDTAGRVSSDGRHYAFVDWNTGNLAVRDLEIGTNRDLTRKGTWEDSNDFAMNPVFSPDNKQVAYLWWNVEAGSSELRIVSVDNPEPRIVNAEFYWLDPQDWSPDGTGIMAKTEKKDSPDSDLSLISVEDGSVKTVKNLGKSAMYNARFSPDGRYIAYDRSSDSGRLEHDIFLIDLAGGKERPLANHRADELVMEWTLDGKALLFKSDRAGTKDLWSIQIENGVATGEPQLLRVGIGNVTSLGLTRDSGLYYGVYSGGFGIYRATVDVGSGQLLTGPQEILGSALRMALSPDGQYIANWTEQKGRSRRPKLQVLDLETNELREIFASSADQIVDYPVWSKDNRWIFQHIRKTDDQIEELFLIDTQSDDVTPLAKDALGPGGTRGSWAAAFGEDVLLYVRWDSRKESFMAIQRDLKDGKEKEFILVENPGPEQGYLFEIRADLKAVFYTVSPKEISSEHPAVAYQYGLDTGRKLELLRRDHAIRIYPAPNPSFVALTGEPLEDPYPVTLFDLGSETPKVKWSKELPNKATLGGEWTPDGRHLLLAKSSLEQGETKKVLWAVSFETGEELKTGLSDSFIGGSLFVHPDGKQVFYRATRTRISEVWRIENFLPQISSVD